MNPRELINHINPPQYFSTLIAYTLASDVLHIFEKEHPNDLCPRKALDLIKRKLDREKVSKKELTSAADAAAHAANAAAAANAAYAAAAAANAVANAAYAAAYADAYTAGAAAHAASNAYWAAKVTSEEHAVKLIYSMMPQLIDYTIKNQVKLFTGPGDFSEVFDKLDDETREKVVWNLELFK